MDNTKPAEILLYDFLFEVVDAALPDDPLFYQLELHDTIWQSITKDRGVRISDATSFMSPEPGGGMKEFDARIVLVCYSKVKDKDQKARVPALTAVFLLQQAIYQLLYDDPTLGDRVCGSRLEPGSRGYDNLNGKPYAVANIPLVINPTEGGY